LTRMDRYRTRLTQAQRAAPLLPHIDPGFVGKGILDRSVGPSLATARLLTERPHELGPEDDRTRLLERPHSFSDAGRSGPGDRAPIQSRPPTMRELERHAAELRLLAETSGSEGGKTQEVRVPAARHPLLDARPV
jgi:hypothetical protein